METNQTKDCCGGCCSSENTSCCIDGGLKKAAKWAIILLAVFLLAKTVNEFKQYQFVGRDVPANSTISVSGTGEVVAVPDIATFSFSVTEESLSVEEAQKKSADSVNAIMSFLEKSNIAKKDIKTSGYNIYPRYEYSSGTYYPEGKRSLAAYVVSQSVEVKIRKIADAGKILGGIGELGATDVSGLAFGFDKDYSMKADARKEAVTKAKEQARVIARDLGVSLGRIVSYSENENYPIMYGRADVMTAKAMSSVAPEITPGENKIKSVVNLTYEIK